MRTNKKGLNFHFLLALGIFITVMSILIVAQAERMTLQDRPLGTAQFSLLQTGLEQEKSLTYLDEAGRQAAEQAATKFHAQGGVAEDYEGGGYPCGSFLDTPTWLRLDNDCIPDFDANLKTFFNAALFPKLNAQQDYRYPSFSLTTSPVGNATKLSGTGTSPAIIRFTGGGKQGMTLSPGTTFNPDYHGATVTETLNHGSRGGNDVEFVVVHYTASGTLEGAVRTLRNVGYSYHYLIDHDGSVHQYVPEGKSAYHAGCDAKAAECKRPGSNQPSIGISFVNCGHKEDCGGRNPACSPVANDKCWEPYTKEQIDSFVKLVADVTRRHGSLLDSQGQVTEDKLVMHSDIKSTKPDPGPAFERHLPDYLSRINTAVKNQPKKVPLGESQQADQTNTPTPGRGYSGAALTVKVQERIAALEDPIDKYADKYGLEPAILKAFIAHESRGEADAESPTGALGLMQIIPSYHHDTRCVPECGFSKDVKKEDYFDPDKNICCGADLIAEHSRRDPITWDCCGQNFDKDICIRTTYTMPYEIAARRYNTAKCEPWADPNFVEDVMGLYEFFGGTPAQFRDTGKGTYPGTYTYTASFQSEAPINLKRFESFETFARDAGSCTDDTDRCIHQALAYHNRTTPDDYNLSDECFRPLHAQKILGQLAGCLQAQPGTTCELDPPKQAPERSYDLVINRSGAWLELKMPEEDPLLALPGEGYDRYLKDPSRPVRANITFHFIQGSQEIDAVIEMDKAKEKLKDYHLRDDGPLVFTRLADGLAYGRQGDASPWKPYEAQRIFCTNDTDPVRFVLALEDRIPPVVEDVKATYLSKIQAYFISWAAVTRYPDGTGVPDVTEYRVYCSTTGLPSNGPLPEKTLAHTVSMRDDGYFTAAGFQGYEFSLPLFTCGGKNAGGGPISVAVVPVDVAGQYNHSYTRKTFTPQTSIIPDPAAILRPDPYYSLKIEPDPFSNQKISLFNQGP